LLECHGSIHHLQCAAGCCRDIWSADTVSVDVDMETIRATSTLPTCRKCGGLARPNILMFNDGGWLPHRSVAQEHRYRNWQAEMSGKRVVAIEIGAGLGVPTVRLEAEDYAPRLIRINPRESDVPRGAISLPGMALKTLQQLDALIG
jgi:NAD-dependent SIR2 family protein deacetylase